MINVLIKLFGGRVRTALASLAVWLALWIVAQLLKLDPHLAAAVDPEKLATFLTAAFFTGINLLTNTVHIKALDEINAALQSVPVVPVEIPEKCAKPIQSSDPQPPAGLGPLHH